MTEVFIIPDGEHLAYYRQFGKLNRIEPIKLEDGTWCLPTRILPHLDRTYTSIKLGTKRFDKRKDVSESIINYAKATKTELQQYPIKNIEEKDISSDYKEKVGTNGKMNILQRLGLQP